MKLREFIQNFINRARGANPRKALAKWGDWKAFFLWVITFLLVLIFLTFISYHLIFAKKIIPNVFLGSAKLSAKDASQARSEISNTLNNLNPHIIFTHDGKKYEIDNLEIGFYYDINNTLIEAFGIGRKGDFFNNLLIKIKALKRPVKIKPAYIIDDIKFAAKIESIQAQIGNQPVDSAFFIDGNKLEISDSKEGIRIDEEKIINIIIQTFITIPNPFIETELPIISKSAAIESKDLQVLKDEVSKKVFNPPTLIYAGRVWNVSFEQMLELLSFKENPSSNLVEMLIDHENINEYVASIENQINTTSKAEEFEISGDRVLNFKPAVTGKALNSEKLLQDLIEYIIGDPNSKQINLNVAETKVPSGLNEYGIKEVLGEGHSNFSGSIQGRVHNILLSSARISGVLVPPGEIFSFNDVVGEINADTGYQQSYIIKKGRTVLDDGGGVCQTSTTLFRAVLNAGLKIVKRYAHAYRVGYYEIGHPVGFDATIYRPTVDFQFENDTDNYILVQSEWNESTADLWIRIYGTFDGRKIDIGGPSITNESPPPEPLYIEDESLPKGTTKQIDWSAWGAEVTITRKVTKNGEVLSDDTFKSNYSPWQSVFLVGIG